MDNWKSTSIDSSKYELEQLQEKVEIIKKEHQEALIKKAQEFERWIGQKEQAIEDEQETRKKVEDDLEQAQVEIADLKKQLEQKDKKISNLEEVLVEEHNKYSDLNTEKKEMEKKVASQEILGKELCDFQGYIEKMKSEGKEVKQDLVNKTEEFNELQEDLEKMKKDHDKQINRQIKQIEGLKSKNDKLTDEKKERVAHVKALTKENTDLKKQLESGNAEEKNQSAKKSKDSIDDSMTESNIKFLESQRDSLLVTLERLQKTLTGFEPIIKDKNEKIQDLSTRLEETEMNLEEALKKLNSSKANDKEKKENLKTIKQLQSTLKDWETRQFTNVKLISGLQKEKAALELKLKDYEEKNILTDPDQLQQMAAKVKKLERDAKNLRDSKEKLEQDLAKHQALLTSKTNELIGIKDKSNKSELKIKELEKELRLSGSGDFTKINNTNQNVDMDEVEGLRDALRNLSERYAKLKDENVRIESEATIMSNSNPEVSKLQGIIEHLKKLLKEIQSKHYQKEKEVERLRNDLKEINSCGNKSSSTTFRMPFIKEEPVEIPQQIDTSERQIILDADILDDRQSSNFEEVDVENIVSPIYNHSPEGASATNGSHNPKTSISSTNNSKKNSSSSTVTAKNKKSKLVDVTDVYSEEEGDITCGICDSWDPPLINTESDDDNSKNNKKKEREVDWVGCDCNKWYHKQCTSLKRFTAAFSCKSVKRKCQKAKKMPPLKRISSIIEDNNSSSCPPQEIYTFSDPSYNSEPGELILP